MTHIDDSFISISNFPSELSLQDWVSVEDTDPLASTHPYDMSSEAFHEVLSSLALYFNFVTEVVNSSYLVLLFLPDESVFSMEAKFPGVRSTST